MVISVIMPAYNAASTIKGIINSVVTQTHTDWELIVVDDASTDNTADIIEGCAKQDARIKLLRLSKNQGTAAARNTAIAQAKGEYLAFLDSDDKWKPSKLEKQVKFMAEKNAIISYTATSYVDSYGHKSRYVLPALECLRYNELLKSNIMSCSSVMVRKGAMMPFPHGYIHEDYVVWLQIVKKYGVAYGLNEPLLIYCIGESTKSSNRLKSARMTWNVYREVGYGRIRSAFFVLRYARHSISKRCAIRRNYDLCK